MVNSRVFCFETQRHGSCGVWYCNDGVKCSYKLVLRAYVLRALETALWQAQLQLCKYVMLITS
jgi:hypothetical protein